MRRLSPLVLALVVVAAASTPAAAMYNPRLGRFMQRDPLGYVDGMSAYVAYHLMRRGFDPSAEEIVVAMLRSRAEEMVPTPSPDPEKSDPPSVPVGVPGEPLPLPLDETGHVEADWPYGRVFELYEGIWNRAIDVALETAGRFAAEGHDEFEFNGKTLSFENYRERLEGLRMSFHIIEDENLTPEQLGAVLRDLSEQAGPYGELLFETHSSRMHVDWGEPPTAACGLRG